MPSAVLTSWQVPAAELSLAPGTVHLWRFRLNDSSTEECLNKEEVERRQRFRVPEKARAFAVARTRLRQILSRYLNLRPEDIAFQVNANGKPYLDGISTYFNLSHSGSWGLCALSQDADIGVDLEAVNRGLNSLPLAARFFSEAENIWLRSMNDQRRSRHFFRLWTRKEAWLKGKGGGFSELNLELDPGHLEITSTEADGWWMMNIPVAKGYVGAIAVAGEVERVERWSWEE